MKLMPASRAFATIRDDVASSVGPPNIMVPKQIGEIFRPLRPRLRYCIGGILSSGLFAPSPRTCGERVGVRGSLHESDSRRVPLTRIFRFAQNPTSPRKRGELENLNSRSSIT